jgi:citrate lyase subunit beta/citryl-CoA lyase
MNQQEAGRLRRSLLFVPGAEPRKLERAREARADTLILDLEDAVAPEHKAAARGYVADALRAGGFGDAELAVRVNAPGSDDFAPDLDAVLDAGARTLVLPKTESLDDVTRVAAAIADRAGGRAGRRAAVTLLLLVESPRGIANALTLGAASARIEALCFGHADFALEMGLREADPSRGITFHARCTLAIAAKASGVAPIDCVHLAVADDDGFRADAELGLALGFEGKLCIHPRQAVIANEVYTPQADEIAHARRVLDAADTALANGRGVFTLDGKMIDAPVVAVQRRVLERARRAGVVEV